MFRLITEASSWAILLVCDFEANKTFDLANDVRDKATAQKDS